MDIQALLNSMSAQWKQERAGTQMTLGKLIDSLKSLPAGAEVQNLMNPHSYRGYYSDLSFERNSGTRLASELLADCENAVGKCFCGYKGGDYVMDEETPVWIADQGCCGLKIISLLANGTFAICSGE